MLRKHKFAVCPRGKTGQSAEFDADTTFLTQFKAWLFELVSQDIIDVQAAKWLLKFVDFFQLCEEAEMTTHNQVRITYSCFEVNE